MDVSPAALVDAVVQTRSDQVDQQVQIRVMKKAMDAQGVPFRAQNKLLAKLAPMHREIITR